MMRNRRLGGLLAVAGLAAVGITALPGEANAWWRGGWCCGVGIGVVVPPVVVAPPVYAPPPVYCAASGLLRPAATGLDPAALARQCLGARALELMIGVSRRVSVRR